MKCSSKGDKCLIWWMWLNPSTINLIKHVTRRSELHCVAGPICMSWGAFVANENKAVVAPRISSPSPGSRPATSRIRQFASIKRQRCSQLAGGQKLVSGKDRGAIGSWPSCSTFQTDSCPVSRAEWDVVFGSIGRVVQSVCTVRSNVGRPGPVLGVFLLAWDREAWESLWYSSFLSNAYRQSDRLRKEKTYLWIDRLFGLRPDMASMQHEGETGRQDTLWMCGLEGAERCRGLVSLFQPMLIELFWDRCIRLFHATIMAILGQYGLDSL
ncbi:hypothetical protein B0H66DRAFT_617359 [Apodospora peruviana]|uniref:Uncharacterized protein n=1 Tax=Apodospora peruviana TaxID=516989 RepID=A0AAE0IJM9_9PEZI|nr:hypothetical protein B0H66DRAFT_617359 [Apodospora peruviana]